MTDQEPVDNQPRPALEPLASPADRTRTAPARTRITEADASGTTLTIRQASERYAVSDRTLRRRVTAGEIAGAHRRPGPKGEEWQIPVAALESLGYKRLETAPDTAPAPQPTAGETDTTAVLLDVIEELRAERRQLTEGKQSEADKRQAVEIELAATRASLEAERSRREAAESALAERQSQPEQSPATRKRWWQRAN